MKYRHEELAALLIDELCSKEAGIMKAERAISKISRDYRKFARNMAIIKNSMDRASDIYNARLEGEAKGKAEGLTQRNYEIAKNGSDLFLCRLAIYIVLTHKTCKKHFLKESP